MIKIIKHGKKKETKHIYIVTCLQCGCEFECETEDCYASERTLGGKKWVKCPDCGEEIEINSKTKWREEETEIEYPATDNEKLNKYLKDHIFYQPVKLWGGSVTIKDDPCETCPNKGGPKDAFGNPVVGDSPCQWCPYYKWRVTYSSTIDSATFSNTPAYSPVTPTKEK